MENIETASNLTFIYLSLHSWVGSVSRSGISLGQRACTCVILLYRTYTPTGNVCEHLLPHTVSGVIQLTSNWFYTNSWLTEVSLLSSSSSGSFNKYLWGATRCKGDVFLNMENKTHQWYEQKLKFTEGKTDFNVSKVSFGKQNLIQILQVTQTLEEGEGRPEQAVCPDRKAPRTLSVADQFEGRKIKFKWQLWKETKQHLSLEGIKGQWKEHWIERISTSGISQMILRKTSLSGL